MPSAVDIAYSAGLYDGEGTVQLAKYYWANGNGKQLRKTPQIKIRITMTDLEPLQRMQRIWGGNLLGPYQYAKVKGKPKEKYKPFWIWEICSQPLAKLFIKLISPWLCQRRIKQFNSLKG